MIFHTQHNTHQKGFTLMELLIVIAIFVIMTGILVANQRRFGANINLTNLSYDVSLSIRQAQTYALGSRGVDGSLINPVIDPTFKKSYGLHFDKNLPTSYFLFASVAAGAPYSGDAVNDTETVQTYELGGGVTISNLCAVNGLTGSEECGGNTLDFIFTRPNPDAKIFFGTDGIPRKQGGVCLVNANGTKKQIQVLSSGQIQVLDGDTCPN